VRRLVEGLAPGHAGVALVRVPGRRQHRDRLGHVGLVGDHHVDVDDRLGR
jgi:hypothetical protein